MRIRVLIMIHCIFGCKKSVGLSESRCIELQCSEWLHQTTTIVSGRCANFDRYFLILPRIVNDLSDRNVVLAWAFGSR